MAQPDDTLRQSLRQKLGGFLKKKEKKLEITSGKLQVRRGE